MTYYLVINDDNGKAYDIAQNISRKMYQLSVPIRGNNVTENLFSCIFHEDSSMAAIEVDDSVFVPIHKDANADDLLALYANKTEEKIVIKEKNIYKKGKMVSVSDIVPLGIKMYTLKEIKEIGFMLEKQI